MHIKIFILVLLLLKIEIIAAQKCTLVFEPKYGGADLILNEKKYLTPRGDTIEINVMKFYVSNIEFLKNGLLVWKENNNQKLVDAENEKSLTIKFRCNPGIDFNQIKFNVGIDSVTNNAGAMGGDLDPTLGMYWTWQNGYINFKLEGTSPACLSRNNEFQYHIGGYSSPHNTLQKVILQVTDMNEIAIEMDIEKLFAYLDLSKLHHIMSPGDEAVNISKHLATIFTLKK